MLAVPLLNPIAERWSSSIWLKIAPLAASGPCSTALSDSLWCCRPLLHAGSSCFAVMMQLQLQKKTSGLMHFEPLLPDRSLVRRMTDRDASTVVTARAAIAALGKSAGCYHCSPQAAKDSLTGQYSNVTSDFDCFDCPYWLDSRPAWRP